MGEERKDTDWRTRKRIKEEGKRKRNNEKRRKEEIQN